MNTITTWILVLATAFAFCPRSLAQDENVERSVRIEVHVRDFRGKPLDRVLLVVFDGTTTRVDGATDENGNVTLEIELPEDPARVSLAFHRESPRALGPSGLSLTPDQFFGGRAGG